MPSTTSGASAPSSSCSLRSEPASVIESLLPVLPALLKHHRVVVASVQDPALGALREQRDSLSDVYSAAAAAHVLQQRRRASEILTALGVDVVDADAERLPPALADHYLTLKARGLL
ncbi:hypothetical protein [Nocardioides sp. B-3]|uniref:hypothetical protein n=1 Tax=Nocardioides sp. B-3 TaxID=2895565 RepID=UPI0021522AE0|nr:hypothetical protein [Nocardioides sp. B-3]UUZ57837.1 hypothetical protein LP418_15705 [Nocardioides sp. B-3]